MSLNKNRLIQYIPEVQQIAKNLGLPGKISLSSKPKKKWMYTDKDMTVHWGEPSFLDFIEHKDPERRKIYRKRAAGIKLKNGKRAIDKKYSPAWFAYNVTW